jgi:hypothetical protein
MTVCDSFPYDIPLRRLMLYELRVGSVHLPFLNRLGLPQHRDIPPTIARLCEALCPRFKRSRNGRLDSSAGRLYRVLGVYSGRF